MKSGDINIFKNIYFRLKDIFYYNQYVIFNPFGVLRDIKNYRYIIKVMKQIRVRKFWKELRVRLNWFGMPYLVLNVGEEYADFFEMPEEAQKAVIVKSLRLLFDEFTANDLNDILSMKMEQIEVNGELIESILVYFKPIFYFTRKSNVILTILLIFGYIYKDFLFNIYNIYF